MRNWLVTPEDLKKGDLIPPTWYPVEIIEYKEEEASENAKNPGSTNCVFFFKVLEGEHKGTQLKRLFNETAWGFAKNFFAAMKYPKDAQGNYKISSDLFEQSVHHKLSVYVKRGKSNQGNEFNEVADFRPL